MGWDGTKSKGLYYLYRTIRNKSQSGIMKTQEFLNQMKAKCEAKAKEMAALELANWNGRHESQLVNHFGFDQKSLASRKAELKSKAL